MSIKQFSQVIFNLQIKKLSFSVGNSVVLFVFATQVKTGKLGKADTSSDF